MIKRKKGSTSGRQLWADPLDEIEQLQGTEASPKLHEIAETPTRRLKRERQGNEQYPHARRH